MFVIKRIPCVSFRKWSLFFPWIVWVSGRSVTAVIVLRSLFYFTSFHFEDAFPGSCILFWDGFSVVAIL